MVDAKTKQSLDDLPESYRLVILNALMCAAGYPDRAPDIDEEFETVKDLILYLTEKEKHSD